LQRKIFVENSPTSLLDSINKTDAERTLDHILYGDNNTISFSRTTTVLKAFYTIIFSHAAIEHSHMVESSSLDSVQRDVLNKLRQIEVHDI
jgi:hypothetical protein